MGYLQKLFRLSEYGLRSLTHLTWLNLWYCIYKEKKIYIAIHLNNKSEQFWSVDCHFNNTETNWIFSIDQFRFSHRNSGAAIYWRILLSMVRNRSYAIGSAWRIAGSCQMCHSLWCSSIQYWFFPCSYCLHCPNRMTESATLRCAVQMTRICDKYTAVSTVLWAMCWNCSVSLLCWRFCTVMSMLV